MICRIKERIAMEKPAQKLSIGPFITGGAIILLGIIFFVGNLISGLAKIDSGMIRFIAPATTVLSLDKEGEYTIFHEYRSTMDGRVFSDSNLPSARVSVKSQATGKEIPLNSSSTRSTYSMGSREGMSLFNFNVEAPGKYDVNVEFPDSGKDYQTVFSVVHDFGKDLVVLILNCVGILLVALFAGIGLIVLHLVRNWGALKGRFGKQGNVDVFSGPENDFD